MTENTVTTAVAKQDRSAAALVKRYTDDFATVLPSHVKPETWVRLAQGALRRDDKLAAAAEASPQTLMHALLDAARQGLEPGTEQYYLVPRKRKGRPEVLGVRGYQGEIELIYRAGAVSSVVVEAVRAKDRFQYRPGRDERPVHEIDWFGGDRGELVGAYAYAVMKDGATSKVVVLNADDIARAKASSEGSDSEYSPWQKHPEAMYLKTAVHRLQKFVPTSAEYRREQLRAAVEADNLRTPRTGVDAATGQPYDAATGEITDAEIVEDDPRDAGADPLTGQGGEE